jgi:hypothetical protein
MTLGYDFSTQLRGVRQISPGNVVKPTGIAGGGSPAQLQRTRREVLCLDVHVGHATQCRAADRCADAMLTSSKMEAPPQGPAAAPR